MPRCCACCGGAAWPRCARRSSRCRPARSPGSFRGGSTWAPTPAALTRSRPPSTSCRACRSRPPPWNAWCSRPGRRLHTVLFGRAVFDRRGGVERRGFHTRRRRLDSAGLRRFRRPDPPAAARAQPRCHARVGPRRAERRGTVLPGPLRPDRGGRRRRARLRPVGSGLGRRCRQRHPGSGASPARGWLRLPPHPAHPGAFRLGRPGRPRMPARSGPPSAVGRWHLLPERDLDLTRRAATTADALLERHGVVIRGAVAAEGHPGGFAAVYPVLAALEERGAARRGYFVEGLGAAQFALPGAVDRLRATDEENVRSSWRPPIRPTPTGRRCLGPKSPRDTAPGAKRAHWWCWSTASWRSMWSAAGAAFYPLWRMSQCWSGQRMSLPPR